ncbi:hypothetical protein AL073_06295 [Loktanella sp. 1ANDIMAR09]|nr:hypothetical protein AL073_06295 [Loktanella sp. 1ANDIMAR09]
MVSYHEPIKRDFFSKVWGSTQHLDSEIAERVMLKLLKHETPITALPVHDSFIVRRGAEHDLRVAMKEAFYEVIECVAKIDRDESVFDIEHKDGTIIVAGPELHSRAKDHMLTHRSYHEREAQWVKSFGPID